ncbi:type I polyketide synthase [Streptomyces bambusae]|uniref:SDR family NAD(P)-dependent oxidoreductase n=1 Tax=Streptomyces bambusae TaxID=1550616 RepID=A0ABS6ZAB9_9ACTN|nr:type I polyketide synthase [Streptomyces bambusae]MBW5484688.1 SDR family NAD(P)-dependent oxidoreductase [Streptomyces bambusae]
MATNEETLRDYLKWVTADLHETRQRLREVEDAGHEPIAIVGMACRYPGGVASPEDLWRLVAEGGDAIGPFPEDRGWDLEAIYDPDPERPGRTYVKEGGFLYEAGHFDPSVFGISPREALAMDPQQRLVMEASWEAFERAGIDPHSVKGSRTGTFIGCYNLDYCWSLPEIPEGYEGHLTTGSAASVVSGRVAYTFGLEGPAVSVDTACSSGLVALHMAAQALRADECSMALVGGVTVMSTPLEFIGYSEQRGMAADGRGKAFSADADGMALAEGAGILLVERLSDAVRNGHPVLAVVRGTATNQDGASNGMTAPHGPSQQRVIKAALANARLTTQDVDVVEAHGTGTALGDPIEAGALLATYGRRPADAQPLRLGSVKSNIGHTQAASGIAGVIKMVMAMREGVLPRTLHADRPSPHIAWDSGAVELLTEAAEWNVGDRPRRAGVSSFGISGTNAHVIIEQHLPATGTDAGTAAGDAAPAETPAETPEPAAPSVLGGGLVPWPLSGKTTAALHGQAARLHAYAESRTDLDPAAVATALTVTRAGLERRGVVVAADRDGFLAGLDALSAGLPAAGVVDGTLVKGADRPVFVFPGQGSQWAGMAVELYESSPVFAARLDECAVALAPYTDWSLLEVLRQADGAPGFDRVDVVQPALWAVMVALAELWRAAGVEPAAVIGHSQGEIAAAAVAGALSLEDAAKVSALRSKAIVALAGKGGMVSVADTAEAVAERIAAWGDRLAVASVNGPHSTVVSGDPEALDELMAACEADGVRARRINVDYASHGPQVESIRDEVLSLLAGITPRSADYPFFSTVTADWVDGSELDAEYWYTNLRQTVRFQEAVEGLLERGHGLFVESSAHPVLTVGVQETIDAAGSTAVTQGTLRRDEGGPQRFLASLAEAWTHGAPVDWQTVYADQDHAGVDLPTYAFQRERYWLEVAASGSGDVSAAGLGAADHPLLGATVRLADGDQAVLTGRLSLRTHPWLADHAVDGTVLLPGTAFVELAVRAGDEVGCGRLDELTLEAPLVLPADGAARLQLVVGGPEDDGRRPVSLHSLAEDAADGTPWTRHATGLLGSAAGEGSFDLAAWPPPGAEAVALDGFYEGLAAAGYQYGTSFQGLTGVWRQTGGEEIYAEVVLPHEQHDDAARFGLHPALLDAALHAGLVAAARGEAEGIRLPFSWNGVTLHAVGATALRVRIAPAGEDGVGLEIADAAGRPVATVDALVSRAVTAAALDAGPRTSDALHRLDWTAVQDAPEAPAAAPHDWFLLGEDRLGVETAFQRLGVFPQVFDDVPTVGDSVAAGLPAPDVVVLPLGGGAPADLPGLADAVREEGARFLTVLQQWLADERLDGSVLAVVTRGALAASPGEDVTDLTRAPLWGLVRSAQAENPGRVLLVDLDPADDDAAALLPQAVAAARHAAEPQAAVRAGAVLVPRLVRATAPGGALTPPRTGTWELAASGGTLENLALTSTAVRTPGEGEVRVAVRAAGLNFRDVMIALGMYPGEAAMGNEGAGVVTEVGPGVTDLAVGDRVMGPVPGAFGPQTVVDRRVVARIPDGWSFEQAAAAPTAFLTAYYALVDLAGLKAGERIVIHAAAGGVGSAAVQIARHLGAEVFGTASAGKWEALRAAGLDEAHIASSRDASFEERFLAATGGEGVDVVLNSLAGELTDASLRLLPRGGRFVEMGKTDIRDPQAVADGHDGVAYRAFDLAEAGPDRLAEILAELVGLFESGALEPLPVRAWDIRRAPDAFRFMSQAKHTGKIVLTVPQGWDPAGTVLVTGGTGTLGALVAKHLVTEHGVKHLLLTGRRGPEAPGAAELVAEIAALGGSAEVVACDAADREALKALLDGVPADRPLRGVVHAAGVLDDGVIASLDADRLARVLRPKADAAALLHELTRELDLTAFILFSSAAGVIGGPAQGNYAAANAFLDALAQHRAAHGLPATSLAWGLWDKASGMTGHLSEEDVARMARSGMTGFSPAEGLTLLDAGHAGGEPLLVPVRLDPAALRAMAASATLPALARGLVRATGRRIVEAVDGAGGSALARKLAALSADDQLRTLLDLVRSHAAAVLGHSGSEAVGAEKAFKELGFDSLTAVELRNRLGGATGLRLPATIVFDHPTPAALARQLRGQLVGDDAPQPQDAPLAAPAAAGDHDPIAIVGMACRFPDGVDSPEALWQLVAEGRDAIGAFPADRGWDLDGLYDPEPGLPGRTYVKEGGFLHDAGRFDAELFGISPREALAMDPQQRLVLEGAWQVFERAGIDPATLKGSRTGVFVGAVPSGYATELHDIPEGVEGYFGTGLSNSVISGRVAYSFGLEGPAVTVDTACSSSLVALHLAAQALRGGECSMALAGGVAVMSTPAEFLEFGRQRALAADGRCKAFAGAADGTSFSEGVGVLLLERLSDAERNGHRVLAVVRGSATNQDGASNGLTAPNGPSQQRVIRQALANAKLGAQDVDAVEAHGTGTRLGDPIEAHALLATYGQGRADDRPLWLGSLKSNIGHTQAASGIAGVIKSVQALREGVLARTLHVDEPSPHVEWSTGAVELLTEARTWPETGRPRRIGVSSFGLSGTNAHVILEQAPRPAAARDVAPGAGGRPAVSAVTSATVPWTLSGKNPAALAAQAQRLHDHLAAATDLPLSDVGLSLATTRTTLEHRAAVVLGSREEALAGLASLAAGAPTAQVVAGTADLDGKTVFVFPGQGSQWAGMAVELLDGSPLFAARFAEVAAAVEAHVDWSVEGVLRGAEGAPELTAIEVLQPVLFTVMVSLAELWQAAGVRPDAVVGHSQGEIAAAAVSGALSLQDAAKIVVLRSQLFADELVGRGAVASVSLGADVVRARIAPYGDALSIAGINGPGTVTVAGEVAPLQELVAALEAEGVRAKVIPSTVASHCAQVDRLKERILELLAFVEPRKGSVPLYSTVTGAVLEGPELDAAYWYENCRQPVSFEPVVRTLLAAGHRFFVEASAHPVLVYGVMETAEAAGTDVLATGTLRRDEGGPARFQASLAAAWTRGAAADWAAVLAGRGARTVELPTYAFQQQRYWLESDTAPAAPQAPAQESESEFWAAVEAGDLDALAATAGLDGDLPLRELLPGLAEWRRSRRARSTVDSWRYGVSWTLLPEDAADRLTGSWLVVEPPAATDTERTEAAVAALTAQGADVRRLVLDPAAADRTAWAGRLPGEDFTGIVCLFGDSADRDAVATGTLVLVQALGDAGVTAPLWLLTRGAVSTSAADGPADPVQAQLWGLGRVVALEQPRTWGGLVDLPETLDERASGRLGRVLAGLGDEDQVAIRSGGAFGRRLVRAALGEREPVRSWTPRGTVLVTGGTGGVGAQVARRLAATGAEHVVLTSRRGPGAPGAEELAAEIRELGAEVTVAACDMADRAQVEAVLAAIPADRPLTAVVHAVGVVQTTLVEEMTADDYRQINAGKIGGARHLDDLLGDTELDAFVLFSSNSGVWGSGRHGGYAPGNAYLDAFAQARRARGLTATSLAWGAWGGGGMMEGDGVEEYMRRRGVIEMDPDLALDAMIQAVEHDEVFRAVADVDWERFARGFTSGRPSPLIDGIPEARAALKAAEEPAQAATTATGAAARLVEQLTAANPAERETLLLDLVRDKVAAVLGHASGDAVEPGRAFKGLGFDSLTAVELRDRLGAATGLKLAATIVFDYPNPAALAQHLGGVLLPESAAPVGSVLDELDRLEGALAAAQPDSDTRTKLKQRLEALLWTFGDTAADEAATDDGALESATADDMFALLDKELGTS